MRLSALITKALFDMNLIKLHYYYYYHHHSVNAAFYLPTEAGCETDFFPRQSPDSAVWVSPEQVAALICSLMQI